MPAELFTPPSRALDANADPYAGALAYFYATGTTTPQAVYTTSGLGTPHANPVVADAGGKFAAVYFNAALTYRVVVKNSSGSVTLHDIDPVNSTALSSLALSSGGALIGFIQAGAGTVATTVQGKLREFFTATDLSGVVADGTDQTTNLIAGITAHVGNTDRKTIIIPPGMVWHPQQLFENGVVALKERLNIVDLGGMSASRTAGENTKIFGVYGLDPDNTEDTYWGTSSAHHPVFMINNIGTANSTSAEEGLMSVLYARGFWTDGAEDYRSFKGAMIAQYRRSVLDVTQWEHVWRSLAPWEALADGIVYKRWAATTAFSAGQYAVTGGDKVYKATVGGTTGAVAPTHTSGTAVDGTVTWQYIDTNDRLVFGFDQQGRVKSNGANVATDLAAFKQATTDTTTTAVLRVSGTGLSREVRLIAEPTDGAGAVTAAPYFTWTGTVMEVRTGGAMLAAQVENNGDLLMYGGRVGYGVGAGGVVTQITSRTTGVTLNKQSGAITLVSAAGTASWQTFTVTNSKVTATDNIIVNQKSGTDKNMIHVTAVAAGSFDITFATTGGVTVEQPVFNFSVVKGSAS